MKKKNHPLLFIYISIRTFDQTVGTFNELQKYLQGYVATLDRDDKKRHARSSEVQMHKKFC